MPLNVIFGCTRGNTLDRGTEAPNLCASVFVFFRAIRSRFKPDHGLDARVRLSTWTAALTVRG